ncbi:MAG: hypothetical protein LBS18_06945 [Clostridiales bacterium]|jgi:YbbR domain-containing protein|nr:hypothetical protein [Clostridiales bacterium]
MQNKSGSNNNASAILKKIFLDHAGFKIVALLVGIIIWGTILTTQNPMRVKVLENVPLSFSGEYELHSRELVVRGNVPEQLTGVTVGVNIPITNYKDLTRDSLNAVINLNTCTVPKVYKLPVRVSGYNIDSITPGYIEMEIDKLMTKSVPVEPVMQGALPDGYWADQSNIRLNYSSLEIRGPAQDASRVTRAVCYVELNGRTQSVIDAINVILLDADGAEVDSSLFIGGLPTVTVTLRVYPRKTVPVDVVSTLKGADTLAANYELCEVTATPATVDIIGDAAVLETINSITVEGIELAGRKESLHEKRALTIPEGVTVLNNIEEAEVFVDIREKTDRKSFDAIEIQPINLGRKLGAALSETTVDITVEGRVSLVYLLERKDVEAFVDLNGLKEGVWKLPVSIYLGDDETTLELITVLSVGTVTVAIE